MQQQNIAKGDTGAISGTGESSTGDLKSPCCIFQIPSYLTRIKENSYGYKPSVVSIGPYHHGREGLEWIETLKAEFKTLFIRKAGDGVNEAKLNHAVKLKLSDIRSSYSDPYGLGNEKSAIDMMVLDGCFLLMLFLMSDETFMTFERESSLFSKPWVLPSIRRDLLLLENQIPLHVLQVLLDTAKFDVSPIDLKKIALNFFSDSFKHREGSLANTYSNLDAKHLLHLIHNTFIITQPPASNAPTQPPASDAPTQPRASDAPTQPPASNAPTQPPASDAPTQPRASDAPTQPRANVPVPPARPSSVRLTLPANKLRSRGIKFKLKKTVNTFIDISFENGKLLIPEIILDDFLTVVLLNCIALEYFYANASNHITSYAMFMGCLVKNKRDVAYLVEKGILQNYLGTEDEVPRFFKRILNDYVFNIEKSYLKNTIKEVDEYSSNQCHVMFATFKESYVSSPWIFLSKLAALALLLLTIAQVVLAAFALKGNSRPQVIVIGNNG